MNTKGDAVLRVEGVSVEFHTRHGDVHAVNDVAFHVDPGEIVGLVGESGCGKSATLRAIAGLTTTPGKVVSGSIHFAGQDLVGRSDRQLRAIRGKEIGFISQSPFGALNPILSIEKQFANVLRAHRRTARGEVREIALNALRQVGIAGPERVLDGYAHQLSGGMAQRVVIALAMLHEPRLVLADEPTTALDVTVQRQILDLMSSLVSGQNRSMLLVTHDLSVVAQYCSRVVVMYAGRAIESGDVRTVFTRPAHPYTRALLEAVPRVGGQIKGLRGGLPDLIDYPAGCPYADRCPIATDVCTDINPAMREFGGAEVACHHAEEVEHAVA